ncbi:MAG: hypothetical protein H5U22_01760 [Rhizobium sp.]|nr:hypothetical protein [Rhizobium sp.]
MLAALKNFISGPLPETVETMEQKRGEYAAAVIAACSGQTDLQALQSAGFMYRLRRNGSRRLVVMLSATAKYTLQKYPFDADVLFLVDVSGTYFCLPCERIAALVKTISWRNGYRTIDFVGCSKGGTGALNIAATLVGLGTRAKVNVLSFSPQTQIYPHDKNGDVFASYKNLAARLEKQPALIPIIARSGNLATLDYSRLNSCTVFFGSRNKVDALEARRLSGCRGVELSPIETTQHYTLGFFTIPPDVDIEHARQRFAEADDPDVVAMRTDNAIEEYLELSQRHGYDLAALLHRS